MIFLRMILLLLIPVCSLKAQEAESYLVRMSPDLDITHFQEKGLQATYAYPSSGRHRIFFDDFLNVSISDTTVLAEMLASGELLYWENPSSRTLQFEPSDVYTLKQWHLRKIEAPSAWELSQGDSSFVVGIIDSGVDYRHEDLKDNLAYNHDDPLNGIDDDGDGYTDNYYGWDFGSEDWNPMIDDASAHGSVITGIAAASTNNELGTASPAFHCRYLPVKISDTDGNIRRSNEAILYAAEQGAKVINCSFGGTDYRQSEADVIEYVTNVMDVLVIASAGNGSADERFYPAALDYVIGVGATDLFDQKTSISNYGPSVDLMAPGAAIYGPHKDNQYKLSNGTSISTAVVSGSAILLRSHYPNETAYQIRRRLLDSAEPIDAMNPDYIGLLGAGRLNLVMAMNHTPKAPSSSLSIGIRPNPNSGTCQLDLYLEELGNYQLSVFDVYGKLYYREDFGASTHFMEKSLTLEHLNQGCYTVHLSNSRDKSSALFVVFE